MANLPAEARRTIEDVCKGICFPNQFDDLEDACPDISDITADPDPEERSVAKLFARTERKLTRKSIIGQYSHYLSENDAIELCTELLDEANVHPRYHPCAVNTIIDNRHLLDRDKMTYSLKKVVGAIDAMIAKYKPSRAL